MSAHRWIFVHCPKTAGRSIQASLPPDRCAYHAAAADPHKPAAELRRLVSDLWEEVLVIGSVRNPWDRAVSAWAYQKGTIGAGDFQDWLWRGAPMLSQWAMLSDGDRLIVDYVIRYERLQQDFAEVVRLLGARPCELVHENPSRYRSVDYREHYTEERLVRLVAEQYPRDILEFGYTFG